MGIMQFGIWDNVVYDNRSSSQKSPWPVGFDCFNEKNEIRAFVGDKGFCIFSPDVNLKDLFWQHIDRSAKESCGKCTPCRVGLPLLRERLGRIKEGKAEAKDWSEVEVLARQIAATSLCGVGQSSTRSLLAALEHFRSELTATPSNVVPRQENCTSHVTAPCVMACPSAVDIPRYVGFLKDGRVEESRNVILEKYPLAASCGRVCVGFCETACRRGRVDAPVAIKHLKRYVADYEQSLSEAAPYRNLLSPAKPADQRVAVIGAGPAGVTCAYHLLLRGYRVDVIEASEQAGGMTETGIPSYRLPKMVLKEENRVIEYLGGRFLFGRSLGRDFSIDDLFARGYKAIFLAIGCSQGTLLGVNDEDPAIEGYFTGIDFLAKVYGHVEKGKPFSLHGVVAVVGGGNVAMDCVRSALRLGAKEVHLIYRRARTDMPADPVEITAAEKEGVIFHFMTNPSRMLSRDGRVAGVELMEMRHTVPDKKGRIGVAPVEGSRTPFACDYLIAAIGQQMDETALSDDDGIDLSNKGYVAVSFESQQTSRPGVFAAGDCSTGPSTMINAMAGGMTAAENIDAYLRTGQPGFSGERRFRQLLEKNRVLSREEKAWPVRLKRRAAVPELEPEQRKADFSEIESAMPTESAYDEADRCLRCYRVYTLATVAPVPAQ